MMDFPSIRKEHKARHLVIAGNTKEFRHWVLTEGNPDEIQYRYVNSHRDLRGVRNATIHFVGSWADRFDADELRIMAKAAIRP